MNLGKETESIEFKKSTSELKEGIKSLVAMLNKGNHGTLYFGVSNEGDIIGQMIGKDTLREISEEIAQRIEPRIIPTITELSDETGKKQYIEVKVSGNDLPYSAYGIYYVRSSDQVRQATRESLRKMFVSSGFDFIKEMPSSIQDLNFTQFIGLLIARGYHFTSLSSLAKAKELKNDNNELNEMAFLLSDESNISIKVVKFNGLDKTEVSQIKEFGNKCLLLSLSQSLEYIESLNETNVDLTSGERKECHLFDFESFREAWGNAMVHNLWSSHVPPAIYIYNDRIEVTSYGGLPYGLSLDEFYKGSSKPINKALWSIFNSFNFAEQTGHGVPTIIKHYGTKSFTISDHYIVVTIHFSFKPTWAKTKEIKKIRLTKTEKEIIALLNDNPNIKVDELELKINKSSSTVKFNIKKIKEVGILYRKGSKKDGYWVIDKNFIFD